MHTMEFYFQIIYIFLESVSFINTKCHSFSKYNTINQLQVTILDFKHFSKSQNNWCTQEVHFKKVRTHTDRQYIYIL